MTNQRPEVRYVVLGDDLYLVRREDAPKVARVIHDSRIDDVPNDEIVERLAAAGLIDTDQLT